MSLTIVTFNGSTDGLRFGEALKPTRHGHKLYHWSYDLLNDVFRLWKAVADPDRCERLREVHLPEDAAVGRRIVRARMGRGG